MTIFRILSNKKKENYLVNFPNFKITNIFIKDHSNNYRLPKDDLYLLSLRGFKNSDYDCDCFLAHFMAWEIFRNSPDDYCLIMHESTEFKQISLEIVGKIHDRLKEVEDWDIFFPYDPVAQYRNKTLGEDYPLGFKRGIGAYFVNKEGIDDLLRIPIIINREYMLGFKWGTGAYFVNKKGIESLIKIPSIKQPLDEEILEMAKLEKLKVSYHDTSFFKYKKDHLHFKHRKKQVKMAIFNSSSWEDDDLTSIRKLLYELGRITTENNIDLILSDGSLLGQIRHGGIMPWDDDVDFAMHDVDIHNLKAYLEKAEIFEFQETYWFATKYLKIWFKNGKEIPNHNHKFPFVDIWYYKEEGDLIILHHGISYPVEIYKPYQPVSFEGAGFKLPANPQACLDVLYNNWRTKIHVSGYSHQNEKFIKLPLNLNISVDKNGKMRI